MQTVEQKALDRADGKESSSQTGRETDGELRRRQTGGLDDTWAASPTDLGAGRQTNIKLTL